MNIKVKNTCNISYVNEDERTKALQKQYRIVLMQLLTPENKKREKNANSNAS